MGEWVEYTADDGTPYYFNTVTQQSSWDKPEELKTSSEKDTSDLYWVADEDEGYVLSELVREMPNRSCVVQEVDSGRERTVANSSELTPTKKASLSRTPDDLVQMAEINEPMILHNLRNRFKNDKIYTNVGTILISVNPFKRLPLYTPAITSKYWLRGHREMPPHVYMVADSSFREMLESGKNQSILISGESGAGKTEATKQVLQYIAEVAGSQTGVEQNILHANPILEAFGNAKTLRNNNSSRFGKWIEVMFDSRNQICGARITNYLLEKSRLCSQIDGERNYHIFYLLFAGCSADQKQRYGLEGTPDEFAYLCSHDYEIEGVDDGEEFNGMLQSMRQLGFGDDEIDSVFATTAGCLHLGNIVFQDAGNQDSKITNPKELELSASLLGVEKAKLEQNLLVRKFTVRGSESTDVPLNPIAAAENRDALAKKIYDYMFNWLVNRINKSMLPPKKGKMRVIGVLDIFGFEIFEKNSFEQLCINYTNEKLQQLFNQHTFKLEEQLYKSEKISFTHVDFIDNQPVLDLIEEKRTGVLEMLDEEARMPRGSDKTLLSKLLEQHKDSEKLSSVIKSPTAFVIQHYAGKVIYDVTGFIDKNKDAITEDLMSLLQSSKEAFVRGLFGGSDLDTRERKRSLGYQFRQQLSDLMSTLYATDQHFIRCVKPNSDKVPNHYEGTMALQQLKYSGVFEAVSIRKSGFPFRYNHDIFYQRYKLLVLDKGLPHYPSDYKVYCEKLIDEVIKSPTGSSIAKTDLQLGRTKVLYRSGPYKTLELMRNLALAKVTRSLQRVFRGGLVRRQFVLIKKVKPVLTAAMEARDEDRIEAGLAMSADIKVVAVLEVAKAKNVLLQIREEKMIHEQIDKLLGAGGVIDDENFDQLSAVVSRAESIELKTSKVEAARTAVQKVAEKRQCKHDLIAGVEKQDLDLLEAAIAKARELMMATGPEAKAAKALREVLRSEQVHVEAIAAGLEDGALVERLNHSTISTDKLVAALDAARGVDAVGKRLKNAVVLGDLIVTMRKCLVAEDYKQLEVVLGNIMKIQIDEQSAEVIVAKEELSLKCARDDVEEKLERAVAEFDLEVLDMASGQAATLDMTSDEFPVVGKALWLKGKLRDCKRHLLRGNEEVNEEALRSGCEIATEIGYDNHEEVKSSKALLNDIVQVRLHLEVASDLCEPTLTKHWLEKAAALSYDGEIVATCRDFVTGVPREKQLQMQFDAAARLGLEDMQIDATTALKDIIFKQFGSMFDFPNFGVLRTKDEYASYKMFGKDKAREGFLKYQKGGILTSLTRIDDNEIVKMAKSAFKNVQGYMGDRHYEYTEPLVQEVITFGIKVEVLRDELICQVIKQLIENPEEQSIAKGWELLFFLIYSFPPSDDMTNFLIRFVRKSSIHACIERYIHEANFRPARDTIPTIHEMRQARDEVYSPQAEEVRNRNKADYIDKYVESRVLEKKSQIPVRPSLKEGNKLARRASTRSSNRLSANFQGLTIDSGGSSRSLEAVVDRKRSVDEHAAHCIPQAVMTSLAPVQEEGSSTVAAPKKKKLPPPPPPPLKKAKVKAKAMFAYSGDEGHLTFEPGDIVIVCEQDPSGWWTGELRSTPGILGVFPGNYTKIIEEPSRVGG